MRFRLCVFVLLLSFSTVKANQRLVEFTFTKPHSLLNFVETILDKQGSATLKTIFRESRYNTAESRLQLEKLNQLQLEYTYRYDAFPDSRFMLRSTWDLMIIASARCQTLTDLKLATVGLLPNSDHHAFFNGLAYFDSIYSDLIWNDNLSQLTAYCAELSDYAQKRDIDSIFSRLTTFYGSNWDMDVPFKVCLYPIPAKKGNSTATPKGNIVTCGILLGSYDYTSSLSVVFHEVCHLLYREQSPELQQTFENWFLLNRSSSRILAYQLIDEALATALGNGWVYEKIGGKLDTSDWYNDYYINRFAKAAYVTVKDYLNNGKTVDSLLINDLVIIYEESFPQALFDFNSLFSNIHLVADFSDEETRTIYPALFKNFRIGASGLSTPLDVINLNDLNTHLATRIVLVSRDHKNTWEFVKKHVPEARNIRLADTDQNFVRLYNSPEGFNYVFINLKEASQMDKVLEKMRAVKVMKPEAQVLLID